MVPWLRARVKLREGAYLPAIEEARKVLKANPKDVETENLLKEATEKLLNDAKKVQPPEGARLMPWLPLRREGVPILHVASFAPVHPPTFDRCPIEILAARLHRRGA